MPNLPAYCEHCNIFFHSGFYVSGIVSLKGNTCQCPKCKRSVSIPEGLFSFAGNTITLLQGPEITLKTLQRLHAVVKELHQKDISFETTQTKIENDAPELRSLIDVLPKTRTELYAFLTILIMILSLAITQCQREEPININPQEIINRQIQESDKAIGNSEKQRHNYAHTSKKIGRNEPCHCGSGKKYKFCHGKIY